jgi:sulfur carrier protein
MKITVNGKDREFDEKMDISRVIAYFRLKADALIVTVNGNVVERDRWGETVMNEGDRLDLISLVGGG